MVDGDGLLQLDDRKFSEGAPAQSRIEDIRRIGTIGAYMVTQLDFDFLCEQARLPGENVLAGFFHDYYDVGSCLTKLMSRRKVNFLSVSEAMMYLRRTLTEVPSGTRFYIPRYQVGESKNLVNIHHCEQLYSDFSPIAIHRSGNPLGLTSDGNIICHRDSSTRILQSDSSEQFQSLSVVSLPDTNSDGWILSTKDGALQCRLLNFEAGEVPLMLHKFEISPDIWNGEVRFQQGIEWIKAIITREGWISKTAKLTILVCSNGVLYQATNPSDQVEEIPRFSVLSVDAKGMDVLEPGTEAQSYVIGLSRMGSLFVWNRSGQKRKLFETKVPTGGSRPNLLVDGGKIFVESNGILRTFDSRGLNLRSSLWVGKDDISAIHLCGSGHMLMFGCRDGSILIFDTKGVFLAAEQLCSSGISSFKRSNAQVDGRECFFAFSDREIVSFSVAASN
jgi:hypothetical protein